MSLAKLKSKETKGKQKLLPKLKTILANPLKKRCPSLGIDELESLRNILQSSIDDDANGATAGKFVTNKNICLGLESSLRSINNAQSSCVFISLSIKPIHIVSLIARNAEVKDESQPVYAQPRLEEFTQELFGIRALCMVLPKDLNGISEALAEWVRYRRKPTVTKETTLKPHRIVKCTKKPKCSKENTGTVEEPDTTTGTKSWAGDFISFTKDNADMSKLHLKEDGDEALEALTQIMDKIPNVSRSPVVSHMEVDEANITNHVVDVVESDESEDFLSDYKSLIVHKIKANPNRKPKKKRNKNKKK